MGFDIQNYYTLQQSLTLEDLAKAGSKHTLKGLVKVINKVIFQRAKLQKKNKNATMFLLYLFLTLLILPMHFLS